MKNKNCLNCESIVLDNFCSSCGQKTDTHRITFKNFIFHDVLHGIFHFEKGMLFTGKSALLNPGKASLSYISGKRKPYYNVFYFILITIGLILFFRHFYDELSIINGEKVSEKVAHLDKVSKRLNEIITKESKLLIFLFVPFAALNSFIFFKRKKLNLSEHSIIAGMILLGMLLISLFGNLFFYLDLMISFNEVFANIISKLVVLLIIVQIGHGYYNAFGKDYSKTGFSYRLILFFALMCLEILILFLIIFGFVSNWKYGAVTLSLF